MAAALISITYVSASMEARSSRKLRAIRKVCGHGDDLRLQMVGRSRSRREHGHAALNGLDRLEAELAADDGDVLQLADRRHLVVVDAGRDDEVGDEDAVGIEPGTDVLGARRDENAAVGGHRRDRGATPVEDDELRRELLGQPGSCSDVRARDLPGQPSAAPATADRAYACQRGRLEVVGSRVTSRPRQLEQAVQRRRGLDQLGLGRAATTHRDDDHVAVAGEHARELAGERRLPDPLAGADDGKRRKPERLVARGLEVEVRPEVAKIERERAARQL